MKHLVLVPDGMADFPLDELDGRTPLEAAHTPAMDAAAARGVTGLFAPVPPDLKPGSDVGNLSLFGYDPHTAFTGRAPLEAASRGIALADSDVAFRCNLVTLADGIMKSFTSGHISSEEAETIIATLNQAFAADPIAFHPGVSYRHLAVVSSGAPDPDALTATQCTPPHDISDQPFAPHLPSGPADAFLRDLMDRSQQVLPRHPTNAARTAAGRLPATSIWLWGQGRTPHLDTYGARFGISGIAISAVDLLKGIALCAGLEVADVPGATGYLDTNYEGKVEAALRALDTHDFAFLHVEAPDEAAHEGRIDLKTQAIEDFDRRVAAPCLEYLDQHPGLRILIAPDHITAIATKTHEPGPVPFAMCGAQIQPGNATALSERAARDTGLLLDAGHTLVPAMLTLPHIDADTLKSYCV